MPYKIFSVLLFVASIHIKLIAQIIRPHTINQLPLVGVNAMIQDKEGYVWYATTEGGLCRDNGYQIDVFRNDQTNTHRLGHSNGILSICETENGDICFGTRENIYLLRKSDYSIKPLDTTIVKGKVKYIFNGRSGGIVAQTGSGWCLFNKYGKRIKNATEAQIMQEIPNDTSSRTCFIDHIGNSWRISNTEPCIEIGQPYTKLLPPTPHNKQDLKSCSDDKGFSYIGDSDGITIYYKGSKYKRISNLSNIRQVAPRPHGGIYFISAHDALAYCSPNGTVTSLVKGGESKTIAVTTDGTVWIGGWHGEIWQYDAVHKKLIINPIANLSDSNPINGMTADRYNRLWIVTDRAIKIYDIPTNSYRLITTNNPSADVHQFFYIENIKGNIIAYGKKGNIFLTPIKYKSLPIPTITLTNIITDGKNSPLPPETTEVSIDPKTERTELRFSTFDHVNASDIVMSYRINNGEWHSLQAGINQISFIQLHKGDYNIDIKFTGSVSQNDSMRTFKLHRLPAWWETWWAYLIYAMICIGIAISIDRIYICFRKTRQKLKEVQAKLDEFMHDKSTTVAELPLSISTNKTDQEFIEKAMSIIEQHLSDCDYDMTQFAQDLCMSRAKLYRIFSTTTGKKPLEFIRSIRLKRAEEMLYNNPNLTIENVATMTGFASVSNFSKRFKEMFGITPSEARQ